MFKSLIYLEFIFVPEERQKYNLNFLKCKIKPTIFTQSTDYDLNWFQVSTSMYTQLMLLPELSVHSVMMHTCMSELGLSLSFLHWIFLENGTPELALCLAHSWCSGNTRRMNEKASECPLEPHVLYMLILE